MRNLSHYIYSSILLTVNTKEILISGVLTMPPVLTTTEVKAACRVSIGQHQILQINVKREGNVRPNDGVVTQWLCCEYQTNTTIELKLNLAHMLSEINKSLVTLLQASSLIYLCLKANLKI